jgi:hypothetical protein
VIAIGRFHMESTSTTPTPDQTYSPPGDSTVVAVFESLDEATEAIKRLGDEGFPVDRISIVGQGLESEVRVHGFVTTGDVAKSGARFGAVFGGLFGLLAGAAFLAIPGVGPLIILGPLAGAVVGAAEGAAATGIVGAVLGYFLEKDRIPKYSQHLKAGRYLVLVHGSQEEAARAQEILRSAGSSEVSQHDRADSAAAAANPA